MIDIVFPPTDGYAFGRDIEPFLQVIFLSQSITATRCDCPLTLYLHFDAPRQVHVEDMVDLLIESNVDRTLMGSDTTFESKFLPCYFEIRITPSHLVFSAGNYDIPLDTNVVHLLCAHSR